jgi:predicted ester cyclase
MASARGTQIGEFMGSATSGRTFDVDAIDIVRMQDGRIVEHWGVIDEAGMARRLGIAA